MRKRWVWISNRVQPNECGYLFWDWTHTHTGSSHVTWLYKGQGSEVAKYASQERQGSAGEFFLLLTNLFGQGWWDWMCLFRTSVYSTLSLSAQLSSARMLNRHNFPLIVDWAFTKVANRRATDSYTLCLDTDSYLSNTIVVLFFSTVWNNQ